MALLPLIIAPDPLLKKVSLPVTKEDIDDKFLKFLDDMLETMYENKGLGLAAVQVGLLKRVIAMDCGRGSPRYEGSQNEDSQPDPFFLINPEIIWQSEELFVFEEGCLSFPSQFADVERPKKVQVKYYDQYWNEKIREFEGLNAVCIQHEMDHLEGIVFVEHVSKFKRDYIMKKMEKMKKKYAF